MTERRARRLLALAAAALLAGCGTTTPSGSSSTTAPPARSVLDPAVTAVEPPPLLAAAVSACAGHVPAASRPACVAGVDAYVWGYALVAMLRTRQRFVCALGSNRFVSAGALAGPSSCSVVAPNNDTLYSTAWLDLRSGPMVLSWPGVSGRYADFQMMDAYSNTFADVGVLTAGDHAGRYAIVAPGWTGTLPAGVVRIPAPTPDVWLLGRTAVDGPGDLAHVVAIQRSYGLAPLNGAAPAGACQPCGPSPQAVGAAGVSLFDEIATDMAADPPLAADAVVVQAMAAGGIAPGRRPTATADPATLAAYARALTLGRQVAAAGLTTSLGKTSSGWVYGRTIGSYGTNYVLRANVAQFGLGANLPTQAVYFSGTTADGRGLNGRRTYVVHFAAGQLPPFGPDGFWSLTMYGADHFLTGNAIDRYSIGNRTAGVQRNPDGSLDLYLSATAPAGHASNWLPAPAGRFSVTLRVYAPMAAAVDGGWVPPTITPTG